MRLLLSAKPTKFFDILSRRVSWGKPHHHKVINKIELMINLLLAPKSEINLVKSVILGYKLEIRENAFSHFKLNLRNGLFLMI